jgi:hypothetical protein
MLVVPTRRRFAIGSGLALAGLVVLGMAGCSSAPSGESLGTSSSAIFPNDQAAFTYFVGKGLSDVQAAGIVGNLDQESGVDPTAVQAGGPGRGIAQWSVGGRWDTDSNDNAEWYATMQGQSVDSLTLQLEFIWYELSTFSGYGLASLKAATTVSAATIAFETDFEGCGQCDQATRITFAEGVLAAYGTDSGVVASGGDAAVDGVGTPCTVTSTGDMGICRETTTCAALGGVSTADYCPGPANVECCTGVPDAAVGHDAGNSHDAGHVAADDAGHQAGLDAGSSVATDAGHPVDAVDGSPISRNVPTPTSSSGGCTAARGSSFSDGGWLVVPLAVAIRRRRRSGGQSRLVRY